jgi:hypothetical protein
VAHLLVARSGLANRRSVCVFGATQIGRVQPFALLAWAPIDDRPSDKLCKYIPGHVEEFDALLQIY